MEGGRAWVAQHPWRPAKSEVTDEPFLWFNLLGTLPKSLALLLVGFYFGRAYRSINAYLNAVALITLAVVILGGLGVLIYGIGRRKKREGGLAPRSVSSRGAGRPRLD